MKKGAAVLLSILSDGGFYSGEALARQLGVTRAAIWKLIRQLESFGLAIKAVRGRGYQLAEPLELLSRERIRNKLSDPARQYFQDMEIVFNTASTNSYLLACFTAKKSQGTAVLAEFQSQGRGRRGNKWVSPLASGICLSVAWHFNLNISVLSLLSLYTAVAVTKALDSLGVDNIALKWPNDILLNNKKLGGVLIDMRGEADGPVDVVIGIGLNYTMPEKNDDIDQQISDITSNIKQPLSRNRVVSALLSSLYDMLIKTEQGNAGDMLDEWRRYDAYRGKPAKLLLQQKVVEGIVEGVDDRGSLLLSVNGIIKPYAIGELSLRPKT